MNTEDGQSVSRLYVLVRQDMTAGYQIAQAIHAKDEFTHTYPDVEREWWDKSNTIVVLGVPDVQSLYLFRDMLTEAGLKNAMFYEPDIDQHTALAVEPGTQSAEMLRSLRPAGRGYQKITS